MEIWKDIKDFEGLYWISNLGRVKNKHGKILKPEIRNGYYSVDLVKNKKRYKCRIHRLVAEAFIPNPDNLPMLNHKDENKLNDEPQKENIFIKYYPKRVILLSDTLEKPTLDNLWNYHRHFYNQLPEDKKNEFSFEDLAGIYEQDGRTRLFATCTKFTETEGLKTLPQGNYLCADCTEENRSQIISGLYEKAKNEYHAVPEFTLQLIVLSGILQWNYQIQLFIS